MRRTQRDEFRRLPGLTGLWLPYVPLLILIPATLGIVTYFLPEADAYAWAIRGAIYVAMAALVWRLYSRQQAFSARIREADGKLCTYCGYDMSGVEDVVACSECGKPYEHDDARTRWADTFMVDFHKR